MQSAEFCSAAFLAFLLEEAGHKRVMNLLEKAAIEGGDSPLLLSDWSVK